MGKKLKSGKITSIFFLFFNIVAAGFIFLSRQVVSTRHDDGKLSTFSFRDGIGGGKRISG